ncbi:uncharacterized protein A1O9_06749 [Exophiala aquamarina CBS 119918]|uniref:Uncharacterized protein n=1 Tax=Exophiala aquamarina CBS 119918 TaxID=1182545 RepID=A0A072P9K7_9EURO|nr:uncharacterized protein A1O9_06749 [Exophiala aquamarina CBS 119918]KEF56561.1 hypothetical protein A1O9_06749 [Exophiala aquamarina CBS 119918]
MSSPVNNFLSLIPAIHRVAVISPFSTTDSDESIVPVVQKARRSSSTATADSNTADEPTLPVENEIVQSPTEDNVGLHQFLKLGN